MRRHGDDHLSHHPRGTPTGSRADVGDVQELVVLDLGDPRVTSPVTDRRTFEERYAELAFGLGTVPRRLHVDDPPWRQPTIILGCVLALLALSTLGR